MHFIIYNSQEGSCFIISTAGTPLTALAAVRPAVYGPASCWLSSRLPVKGSAQRDNHSQPVKHC